MSARARGRHALRCFGTNFRSGSTRASSTSVGGRRPPSPECLPERASSRRTSISRISTPRASMRGQRQFGFVPVVIPRIRKAALHGRFLRHRLLLVCHRARDGAEKRGLEHAIGRGLQATGGGEPRRVRARDPPLGKSVLRSNAKQVVPHRKPYLAAIRRLRSARSAARHHCGEQPLLDQAHEPGLAPAHRT